MITSEEGRSKVTCDAYGSLDSCSRIVTLIRQDHDGRFALDQNLAILIRTNGFERHDPIVLADRRDGGSRGHRITQIYGRREF